MEVDLPMETDGLSPCDRIVLRLVQFGLPKSYAEKLQPGLVAYAKMSNAQLSKLVHTILPTNEVILEACLVTGLEEARRALNLQKVKDEFRESILWLQWLMFGNSPHTVLENLAKSSTGQHGVCGAVWGNQDIAYRCRTCEHDPTCAICVPCFQNGDHRGHDYSMIHTNGGCCDCGDETAWKRQGFCSKHKGPEQVRPLPEKIANSVDPILEELLVCWKNRLSDAETIAHKSPRDGNQNPILTIANVMSCVVIEMLSEFCQCSESLLSFIAKRMFSSSINLLDVLVRTDRFLIKKIVKKLHALLLKLLGDPNFKYEFAKVFIKNYPSIMSEAIRECREQREGILMDNGSEKYPLLSNFSVQIFTVPTLTPRLVREVDLLDVLLGSLEEFFASCIVEDGHLQVGRFSGLYDLCFRLVEDIRFVMSHTEVTKFVALERRDISETWIGLLATMQGMDPQKRVTGIHVEEENDSWSSSFLLEHVMANIHPLFVTGAFSLGDDKELKDHRLFDKCLLELDDGNLRHAKIGRLSEENSVRSMTGRSNLWHNSQEINQVSVSECCDSIPSSVTWLILICMRAIENWLAHDPARGLQGTSDNLLRRWKSKSKTKKNRGCITGMAGESTPQLDKELAISSVFSLLEWPEIIYDVSSQQISFHIPLHRFLSLLLNKALETYCDSSGMAHTTAASSQSPLPGGSHEFLRKILGRCHPCGFSAFMMENPLRLRVFCAQLQAGMWRRNGHVAISLYELYHSVRWCEQSLELDLFLLQCCAALAPPENFVRRIQERFRLSDYLSLNLNRSNEYEPVLVKEMLILIIQIVKERRFCGLSSAEILKRELIYRLAIGDATHSQLLKALPHDLSNDDRLQEIFDTIATYMNPSGMQQGKYSLRKECWKELDLYHPRWNSRDLQVAEERYARFCGVSAMAVQLPRWSKVFHPLRNISWIATSKAVLEIIRAVFYYAAFSESSSASRAPDAVLLTALHLLSLGIDICLMLKQGNTSNCNGNNDLSITPDQEYAGTPCNGEDPSFPLLSHACEEVEVGATHEPEVSNHQSLLSLSVLLIKKYTKENESGVLESNHCNIPSLMRSLLKKLAELDAGCMNELKHLAPEIVCHLSERSHNSSDLVASDSERRKAMVRERQAAILEKMRAAQSKFMASLNTMPDDGSELSRSKPEEFMFNDTRNSEEPNAVFCSLCRDSESRSPLSFLVLLQKSRLLSLLEKGPPSWDQIYHKDKDEAAYTRGPGEITHADLVELIRNAVNVVSHGRQTAEVDDFLDNVRVQLPSETQSAHPSESYGSNENVSSSSVMMEHDTPNSSQQSNSYMPSSSSNNDEENSPISHSMDGSVTSRDADDDVLREYAESLPGELSEQQLAAENGFLPHRSASSVPDCQSLSFDGFGPVDCDGIHISSCGHAVHQECRDRYLQSLRQRIIFEGVHIVDPDQGEFLCPVCRRLANSVLPVVPDGYPSNKIQKHMLFSKNFSSKSAHSSVSVSHGLRLRQALSLLQGAEDRVGRSGSRGVISARIDEQMKPALESVFHALSKMYFSERSNTLSASGRVCSSLLLWDVLRYSLMSTEIAARHGKPNMPIRSSQASLEALYKEANSSMGFILGLLLQVCQATQIQSRSLVLMRYRGIRLFLGSICSGSSLDESYKDTQRGDLSSLLKNFDKGKLCPDIRFWKRAADPVLVHDPFSSLMWVLFCLPLAFPLSEESFISLVHLFYVVCMIQAVITCCKKRVFDISELNSGGRLVTSIYKKLGEALINEQHFGSNYFDGSCPPVTMIRRYTLPYLRRCALLLKLLKSSMSAPFHGTSHVWERSSSHMSIDEMKSIDRISLELEEVLELENMFQISPLEDVLEGEEVQTLAMKWCEHFFKSSGVRSYGHVMLSTPAIPFQLMCLPPIYQDLLQRYIKQQCGECKINSDHPSVPALCLLCGRLCNLNRRSCCRLCDCQSHATACGAGIGVFLLIRKTTILLQRSARQAPWPSPYLDAFGEEDIDMQRGKPLYLNEERYAALNHLVVSHGLDQSSEVLRHTTIETLFAF
ncbi:E3 ubiquitin-protein ligase PRT6 isoform X2 [Amborella trichopoda]|uniref:E3 ubiquitin-protein ligase PRT6 isoform X2 n=1 Tax=Amborella trichopoda TaxID=13333 RepID=UPI0009BD14AD|nr:E3 ubiquitin-protein ligase PRT6 isoform X2 [Amborella trichopoda]|eukprot:XP_020524000.1 E3 ubiquitin-protein ligase PRT6 isoform X2 [Amborella trichopoda]